eukprot:6270344-Alexandrium_andersonii.AAC.1
MSASLVGSEMCIRDRRRERRDLLPDVLRELVLQGPEQVEGLGELAVGLEEVLAEGVRIASVPEVDSFGLPAL